MSLKYITLECGCVVEIFMSDSEPQEGQIITPCPYHTNQADEAIDYD